MDADLSEVSLRGDQRTAVLATDTGCTGYSVNSSSFAHGLVMLSVCGSTLQFIQTDYNIAVPGATVYSAIRLYSFGNTVYAPGQLLGAAYNYTKQSWEPTSFATVPNGSNQWSSYGSIGATGYVRNTHISVAVVVPNIKPRQDYDLSQIKAVVAYSVLQ